MIVMQWSCDGHVMEEFEMAHTRNSCSARPPKVQCSPEGGE